jgi:hypothetical protein
MILIRTKFVLCINYIYLYRLYVKCIAYFYVDLFLYNWDILYWCMTLSVSCTYTDLLEFEIITIQYNTMNFCTIHRVQVGCYNDNILESHSGGAQFNSQPGNWT